MDIYGVDLSYHNGLAGPIDWARIAQAGISFATIKATSGEYSGGTDSPAFFRAQAPLMARHIPLCGGYHWLKPVAQTSAARQVETFLDVMHDALGGYRGHLVQLDVEEGTPADVRAWLTEWNRATDGYPVALYLPDWLENQWPGNQLGDFGAAAWWSSEYVAGAGLPYLQLAARVNDLHWHTQDGVKPTVLQYTSRARVAGVTGNCDVNIYRGTLTELTELLTDQEADMDPTTVVPRPENITYSGGNPAKWPTSGATSQPTLGYMLHSINSSIGNLAKALGAQGAALLAEVDQVEEMLAALPAGDTDALADKLAAKLGPALTPQLLNALAARLAE